MNVIYEIIEEFENITQAKENLRQALVDKGAELSKEDRLDKYADAVRDLSEELPETTFTSADLLIDKTAIDHDGKLITGAMPYSQQVMWEGGNWTVEYTAGYLPEGINETAPSAEITETDSQVTVGMGWVSAPITIPKSSSEADTKQCVHKFIQFTSSHTLVDTVTFDTSGFFNDIGLSNELDSRPLTEPPIGNNEFIAISSTEHAYLTYVGGGNKTIELKYEERFLGKPGWSIYADGEFVCFTPGITFVGAHTWYTSGDYSGRSGEVTGYAACETAGRVLDGSPIDFYTGSMGWGVTDGGGLRQILDLYGKLESAGLSSGDIVIAFNGIAVGKISSPWEG